MSFIKNMIFIIYSTTKNVDEAKKIARILVEKRLIACANIIPKIESIYRWDGKLEEGSEAVLIAKTRKENVENTIRKIKELHSYHLPDIVSLPVSDGLQEYLNWVEDETK